MVYLIKSAPENLTGLELFVYSRFYKHKATDWFPILNTRYLKLEDEEFITLATESASQLEKTTQELLKCTTDFEEDIMNFYINSKKNKESKMIKPNQEQNKTNFDLLDQITKLNKEMEKSFDDINTKLNSNKSDNDHTMSVIQDKIDKLVEDYIKFS